MNFLLLQNFERLQAIVSQKRSVPAVGKDVVKEFKILLDIVDDKNMNPLGFTYLFSLSFTCGDGRDGGTMSHSCRPFVQMWVVWREA